MEQLTSGVNWLAVGAGTVASFVLGWLWYSPMLFGKPWAAAAGITLPEAGSSEFPVVPLITQLAATFLLAWLIGVIQASLPLAALIIATIALFIAANDMFVKKGTAAILVECGFVVAIGTIMIAVHSIL